MKLQHVAIYLCFTFSSLCLKPSSAQDIPCTVTQDGGQTLYSVPEFKATDCYYQWYNRTNHVLANPRKHLDEQVVMKSNRTLLTYMCSEQIHYSRICMSEGKKRMATCTTNCSGDAPLQNGETSHIDWIVPTAAVAGVLLLLLLLLLGYCIQRKLRCLYSAVKTQINEPV